MNVCFLAVLNVSVAVLSISESQTNALTASELFQLNTDCAF